MAKKKQLSQVQKSYNQQRKRLENVIKKSVKEDYIFPEDILPKQPKKITQASVNKLAKITPQQLKDKAEFVVHETGDMIPVKGNKKAIKADMQWRKENERKEQKQEQGTFNKTNIPKWTDIVVQNWERTLDELHTSDRAVGYGLLKAWEDTIVAKNGIDSFAQMLQDGADAGNMLTWEVVYFGHLAMAYISSMLDYLPDSGIIYKEQVLDKMQFMEHLADAFEDSYEE